MSCVPASSALPKLCRNIPYELELSDGIANLHQINLKIIAISYF
jgi:hypothetical protein